MKTKQTLAILLFAAACQFSFAQQNNPETADAGKFNFEMISGMIQAISIKDFATQPYHWGFSYVSPDKEKLQKFTDALNKNEKTDLSIAPTSSGSGYICSVRDYKIYTAQTLYDRINELNSLAKTYDVDEVKCFGLMEESK